jgi:hypothetical protein
LDPGIPIDHFFLWDMMGLFDAHMLYVWYILATEMGDVGGKCW